MSFVGNLKAASQASVESTARSPLKVQCFAHERCCTQPIAMNSVIFYLPSMNGPPGRSIAPRNTVDLCYKSQFRRAGCVGR